MDGHDVESDHQKAQKLQTLVSCLMHPFYFVRLGAQNAPGTFQTQRWTLPLTL